MKYNISIALMIFFLISCNDEFLDLAPITFANENEFYQTDADFESAAVGLYSSFGQQGPGTLLPFQMEYRADNLEWDNNIYIELSQNLLGPNTGSIFWNMYATLVFPANNILEKVDEAGDIITPSVKDKVSGEALFFRGYAYYWMNLGLGSVPKITSAVTAEEALEIGLSPADEILDQAISDFAAAAALLPETSDVFGRLDRYDALTFQAKALMLKNDWSTAVPILQDVFENSRHALEPVWIDMWTTEAEKTSQEFMFQVVYNEIISNNTFVQQLLYIPGDNTTQEVYRYKEGLFDSFEPNDIRRDETLGFDPNGSALNNKYDFGNVNNIWTNDIQVLRFTDVQLLYAEAISMSAGSVQQQSLDLINEIRNRAGIPELTLLDVPNLDAFVEAVLSERRSEFVFEGKRYPDLKRHGLLLEKLNEIGYNFDSSYLTIPIPQTEKDKVPGLYD
jgi:hypothetical protein